MDNTLWYKDAIFYEVYVRAFSDSNADGHGDLRGLMGKLDYLRELGVTCLWLQPIYPSPLKDDGYYIADHYGVHPDYGTLDDFKALVAEAHARGLRVITDLVLNHTSDEHPWFQARGLTAPRPSRFYVWAQTGTKTRVIFLDTEPSNWTYDARATYWHRYPASPTSYDSPGQGDEGSWFLARHGGGHFRATRCPTCSSGSTNCKTCPDARLPEAPPPPGRKLPRRILLAVANQWPGRATRLRQRPGCMFPAGDARIFAAQGRAGPLGGSWRARRPSPRTASGVPSCATTTS
jgi:maltose alpha-D-glucosyltransferase/alpha-amylase